MIGDGMLGSSSDVNQGITVGGERTGRGQSPRSSEEASNDRGAKGGRDVVWGVVEYPSRKGPGSAARLCARMHRNTGPGCPDRPDSEPPATQVSGAQACAAGATLLKALSPVPEPVHQRPRTGKPDAGDPPVRFGWRATARAVLYPHSQRAPPGQWGEFSKGVILTSGIIRCIAGFNSWLRAGSASGGAAWFHSGAGRRGRIGQAGDAMAPAHMLLHGFD